MLLTTIVETSARVAATRSRKEKIGRLATCLRQLPGAELTIGTAYLAGQLPQGRVGIGPSVLQRSRPASAASSPRLTLSDIDKAVERIIRINGYGSSSKRIRELLALLTQATRAEQDFLEKLILGELRQGALEGLMADAIGEAAEVPASTVRRAWMLADNPGAVAAAALR